MKKLEIEYLKELKNKKIFNSINICVTIVFIISLIAIQTSSILAPNVSICVEYDYVPDGTVSEIHFEMKDNYIESVTSSTKVFNDKAIFNINPEAFSADSIKYYVGDVSEKFSVKSLTFYSGKNSNEKGYLVGLLTSSLLIFLMFVINSIFYGINLKLSTIIYYLILILTGVIGGTIGINKKKEDN